MIRKKFLLIIIVLLALAGKVLANPIPVFYLTGWIGEIDGKNLPNIIERDVNNRTLKYYDTFGGNTIIERDTNQKTLKYYDF